MRNKTRILFSLTLAVLTALTAVCHGSAAVSSGTGAAYSGTLASERTRKDIVDKWLAYDQAAAVKKIFDNNPSVTAPYQTGKLNQAFLNQAELYFNYLRYAAGLPDIRLDDTLTDKAQHGAVLLAANGELTHTPPKPAGMSDAFYQLGASSTATSNISMRYIIDSKKMLISSLQGCIDDSNSTENLLLVGHRQWMLNPALLYTGFGYAGNAQGYDYAVTQITDNSGAAKDYSFISWPAQGEFPNNIIEAGTPWSVTLNPQKYQKPELEDVAVKVTRLSDGKAWTLTDEDYTDRPDRQEPYLNVSRRGLGVGNCIIFYLGTENFTADTYSENFTVEITGLKTKNGAGTSLTYSTHIFDFQKALSAVQGGGEKGDVNGDWKIDTADVLYIQRYLAGVVLLDEKQKERADVNGDGAVSVADVLLIQRYLAHEISGFD